MEAYLKYLERLGSDIFLVIDSFLRKEYMAISSIKKNKESYPRYMDELQDIFDRIIDVLNENQDPYYANDVQRILKSFTDLKGSLNRLKMQLYSRGEVLRVKPKDEPNYSYLRKDNREMKYYFYVNRLSERLTNLYNKYEDPKVRTNIGNNPDFIDDIQDILNRINTWKEEWQKGYNNYIRVDSKNQITKNIENIESARLRSPLNRLSEASPYKKWFRKTRRNKKRSTRKRK
jgi:hypothetical protein